MTIEQLNKIIANANLKTIERDLAEAGFMDCKKDEALKKISVYNIVTAQRDRAKSGFDRKGYEYAADIYHGVKGYEQYQFVVVELLKPIKRGSDIISTAKMLIYATK